MIDGNLVRSAAKLIKQVQQRDTNAVDAALAPMGLSLSLWCAIDRIASNPGLSTHALAELTCLTDQSFSALVAKLAERGLVKRTHGSGRVILHELTDDGVAAYDESTPIVTAALHGEFSALAPDELAQLVGLLTKVNDGAQTTQLEG